MKHYRLDGIRGAVLLMALAVTTLLGGCAERKPEPAAAGADTALIKAAEPTVSTTPEVIDRANSPSPNAADKAVSPPAPATAAAASTQSPATPEPARPHSNATPQSARPHSTATPQPARSPAPGIAVGEPDPTHAAPATSEPRGHMQRDSGAGTGKSLGADCRTDSDCAVKNVGSCCGYRPQCLNKATPTFPEQVKARCGQEGRVGICGFQAITSCECVAGKCAGITLSDDSTQVQ